MANAGAHALYDAGNALDFTCITSHEKLTSAQSWWVAPRAWMKLQARVRRAVKDWQYFLMPETQQSGDVHFHMIQTARLPKAWWKDNARACGFGYMDDTKEVYDLGGAVGYAAKYLTKAAAVTGMPKGTRRYRMSRQWPREPSPPIADGWEFGPLPRDVDLERKARALERAGWRVTFAGSKSSWDIVNENVI